MSKSQPLADERDASNAESIDWDNRLLTLLSRLNQGGISDEDDDLKENNYQVIGTLNETHHIFQSAQVTPIEMEDKLGLFICEPKFQAETLAWRQKFWPGQKFRLADE